MKVEFHKSHWRMKTEVVRLILSRATNPGEVSFFKIELELLCTMFQYRGRIVLVENDEQLNYILPLLQIEYGDWTSFYKNIRRITGWLESKGLTHHMGQCDYPGQHLPRVARHAEPTDLQADPLD